jgi:GDP-L-fucose synthase
VIHCAAHVGGIGLNRAQPADLFYDNLIMGTLTLQYAWRHHVPKFVAIGTVCSYPAECPTPFREETLWDGYPEPTNAPYGLAKRMLVVQAAALRQQYGYDAITVIPTNLYGPGADSRPATSHVIPAIIAKIAEAQQKDKPRSVSLWGSGQATRDFLHVRDAARGIVLAANEYSDPMPINLGGTGEISILALATSIAQVMEFEGYISFDHSNPDGQKRRVVSSARAEKYLNWKPAITLNAGLQEMIEAVKA